MSSLGKVVGQCRKMQPDWKAPKLGRKNWDFEALKCFYFFVKRANVEIAL